MGGGASKRRTASPAATVAAPAPARLARRGRPADEVRAAEHSQLFEPGGARQASRGAHARRMQLRRLDVEGWRRLSSNAVPREEAPPGTGHLNRYANVLPNRGTMVRLPGDAGDGYINANYIRGSMGEEKHYIATQGPLPATYDAFWRMCWAEGVGLIVMLTGLTEGGRDKCGAYWPATPEDAPQTHGHIVVRCDSVRSSGELSIATLVLSSAGAERIVRHVWHKGWPDHQAPESQHSASGVLRLVVACQEFSKEGEVGQSKPWVVHCSAGVGRSGVFIAIDHGVARLNAARSFDLNRCTKRLRQDRGGMIMNEAQAAFAHAALSEYVTTFNTMLSARTKKL